MEFQKEQLNKENIDYVSHLLFGKPIKYSGIDVYPLTIREIIDFSLDTYNQFLAFISLNKTEIMESLKIVQEVSLYEFLILNIINDISREFTDWLLRLFSLIFRDDVLFAADGYFIIGGVKILNEENFKEIFQIIKDQNFVKERKEVVMTKKVRDYKEMLKNAREKHKGYLKATGKLYDSDLLDYISALSAKHPNLSLLQIEDLTIYQLIDQFKRINIIDDYFISIKSLLAGASKNDVNLQHWSKKITD